jgi:hypothetical protein
MSNKEHTSKRPKATTQDLQTPTMREDHAIKALCHENKKTHIS